MLRELRADAHTDQQSQEDSGVSAPFLPPPALRLPGSAFRPAANAAPPAPERAAPPDDVVARALAILEQETQAWKQRSAAAAPAPGAALPPGARP